MTFRDPLTSLPASAITSGTFSGTYRNVGTFVLAGTPGASRIEASGTELAFYAADGVTKLIDLDTSSGAGVITAATVQSAASGERWVLSGTATPNQLTGYTGAPEEHAPGLLQIDVNTLRTGGYAGGLSILQSPYFGDLSGLGFSYVTAYCKDPAKPTTSANRVELGGDAVQVARGGAAAADVWAGDNLTRGRASGVTDANGRITVAHGLGQVPTVVLATPAGADGGSPILGMLLTPAASWTSTQFVARAVTTAGAAIASSSVTFSWVAIA